MMDTKGKMRTVLTSLMIDEAALEQVPSESKDDAFEHTTGLFCLLVEFVSSTHARSTK